MNPGSAAPGGRRVSGGSLPLRCSPGRLLGPFLLQEKGNLLTLLGDALLRRLAKGGEVRIVATGRSGGGLIYFIGILVFIYNLVMTVRQGEPFSTEAAAIEGRA